MEREREETEKMELSQDFWQDRDRVSKVEKRKAELTFQIEQCRAAMVPLEEAELLLQMAREESDADQETELSALLDAAEASLQELEVARMLSGENDAKNAFLSINAGAGGTESQDWAEMLLRMYLRYCDLRGWKTQMADYQGGEEAGLKSVTLDIEGACSYGYLKAENGIHRLVRISPFDASRRRHTSFASIFVYPQLDDSIEIEVNEKDLRVDVYRASGAGGQKVNKTSSAVRITHIPTGIVVQCQNERSQHKNRDMAMRVLRSRLYEQEKGKQDAEKKETESSKMRINFGSQIRSYVLHPYKLVKDHRTGHEKGNATAVLDGEIHEFIKAFLLTT